MPSYKLSSLAEFDLAEIWRDIADLTQNDEFAINFTKQFAEQFEKLTHFPKMGESRDYLVEGFRKWTFKKYVIYYSIHEEYIRIERILSGKQEQEKHLK